MSCPDSSPPSLKIYKSIRLRGLFHENKFPKYLLANTTKYKRRIEEVAEVPCAILSSGN
jgi:hypothetical protein